MLKLVGNHIYITKGDTAELRVKVMLPCGKDFAISQSDTFSFAMKEDIKDEEPILQLDGSYNEKQYISFKFMQDTLHDFEYGDYLYEIKINLAKDEGLYTIIPMSEFTICPNIHEIVESDDING